MDWRQRSERCWDGIEAEDVIVVPKTHRLAVDDEVMLHSLGLSTQLVILHDVGSERLAGYSITQPVLPQLSQGGLDGLTQRCHIAQQRSQSVTITPRLRGDLLQNLTFDRRQRVAGLRAAILATGSLFHAIEVEVAVYSIAIAPCFSHSLHLDFVNFLP